MSNVPRDVELYHEMVASSVDLSNAHVSKDGVLTVTRSVRDLDNNKRRRFLYTMLLPKTETTITTTAEGHDTPPSSTIHVLPPSEYHDQIKLRLPSPSGKKIAIFRQEGDAAANKISNILELWNGPCLEQRIILSSPDNPRHGKIIYDASGFGQPNWSQDDNEQFLIYAAERNPIKTQTFFATTSNKAAAAAVEEKQQPTDATGKSESSSTTSSNSSSSPVVGASFTLGVGKLEGWGEKYTKQSPLLDMYLVHTGTGRVGRIENVPGSKTPNVDDGVTLGQGVLSPSLSHVVYTAWHVDTQCGEISDGDEKDSESPIQMSRRFGLIYCQQRPCRLYASPIHQLVQQLSTPSSIEASETAKDDGFVCLTPSHRMACSPRFGPVTVKDNTTAAPMVFLSSNKGFDTHSGCLALFAVDWSNKGPDLATLRVVVDQVGHPKDSPPDQAVANLKFPGLFVQSLPDPCFVQESDDKQLAILTPTQWGFVQRIVRISLATGKVTLLPLQSNSASDSYASQALLGVTSSGGAIVAESSPDQPASLTYMSPLQVSNNISSSNNDGIVASAIPFAPILGSTICSSTLNPTHRGPWGMDYEVLNLKPPPIDGVAASNDDDMFPLQCILMRPFTKQNSEKVPLLVVVHGGPHGCSPTTFLPAYAYLCASGYAVLMVNYRGSTGFGQAGIDILPGRIGTLDVKDVVYATNTVVEQHSSWINPDRLGIIGGSHGGFLTGHLTGQYPHLFQAAAMRNPVTNIASMVTATDIPDWCHVEAGLLGKASSFDWTKFAGPTQEELVSMYKSSPIVHVQKVTTPTLVVLGLSDQRVPPSQGLEWYYTLRSKGVPTKLLLYEENDHAIDGVESEADHWINIKRWMDEYLMTE